MIQIDNFVIPMEEAKKLETFDIYAKSKTVLVVEDKKHVKHLVKVELCDIILPWQLPHATEFWQETLLHAIDTQMRNKQNSELPLLKSSISIHVFDDKHVCHAHVFDIAIKEHQDKRNANTPKT